MALSAQKKNQSEQKNTISASFALIGPEIPNARR
jgi:hypothetical protein